MSLGAILPLVSLPPPPNTHTHTHTHAPLTATGGTLVENNPFSHNLIHRTADGVVGTTQALYQHSQEEKDDVKSAYLKAEGDMDKLMYVWIIACRCSMVVLVARGMVALAARTVCGMVVAWWS